MIQTCAYAEKQIPENLRASGAYGVSSKAYRIVWGFYNNCFCTGGQVKVTGLRIGVRGLGFRVKGFRDAGFGLKLQRFGFQGLRSSRALLS